MQKRKCGRGRPVSCLRWGAVSQASCVPWEPSGPEMNEGDAATHYFSYQGQSINTARHTSAADLWGCRVSCRAVTFHFSGGRVSTGSL